MLSLTKKKSKLFGLFFCVSIFAVTSMYGSVDDIEISYESYRPKEFKKFEQDLRENGFQDLGHNVVFINLNSKLNNAGLIFNIERPALHGVIKNCDSKITCLVRNLSNLQEITKNEFPHTILSSRGYLPGEEIEVYFQSGIRLSNILKITPFPIECESRYDAASISAKLVLANPPMYRVSLKGFRPNEKVNILSNSCGEIMSYELDVKEDCDISHMPGVINKNGGENRFTVTRNSGEKLEIVMPWGDEHMGYLRGDKKPSEQ